jgi:hypothetical protein
LIGKAFYPLITQIPLIVVRAENLRHQRNLRTNA